MRLQQLFRREINADRQIEISLGASSPSAHLATCLAQTPPAQLADHSGLFGDEDEFFRSNHSFSRMPPAQKRLKTDHTSGIERDNRLIEIPKFVSLDPAPQVRLHFRRGHSAA